MRCWCPQRARRMQHRPGRALRGRGRKGLGPRKLEWSWGGVEALRQTGKKWNMTGEKTTGAVMKGWRKRADEREKEPERRGVGGGVGRLGLSWGRVCLSRDLGLNGQESHGVWNWKFTTCIIILTLNYPLQDSKVPPTWQIHLSQAPDIFL